MSLAQGNNTLTRPMIEPGSPDPESDALTTRPVRPFNFAGNVINMQFSPIKLPLVHDPQSIKRLHTYSHMKIIGGCVQTFKMLDNNIICYAIENSLYTSNPTHQR